MKKRMCILYCLILLLINANISWGFDKNNIPDRIKIGLRYGNQSANTANLYSSSGFEFGYYNNSEFIELLDILDTYDMVAKKDEYYKIQIGDAFSSKEEAKKFSDSLGNTLYYLVYEDGWKVWTGLYSSREQAEEFINTNGKINDKKLKVVNPNNGRVIVLSEGKKAILAYDSSENEYSIRPYLDKDGNDIISVDGKKYRGEIIIKRDIDGNMTVINYLGLEEYLYGIREVPSDWPLEALKAQAIAARNFAVANIGKHGDHGFDLCNTTDCQVYGGYEVENPRNNLAVDETSGKILTYDGKIVNAFFHSNSGGYTEDSENVWDSYIPYIRGVKDDFSLGAPNSNWTKVYSIDDLKNLLRSKGMNIDGISSLCAEKYSKSGSVQVLKIKDDSNEVTLEKNNIRKVFGYNDIKSLAFKVSTDIDFHIKDSRMNNITRKPLNRVVLMSSDKAIETAPNKTYKIFNGVNYKIASGVPTKYIFNGSGWGHGLGMSQWGAKKMAELGYTYEDILLHYYTGTTIE